MLLIYAVKVKQGLRSTAGFWAEFQEGFSCYLLEQVWRGRIETQSWVYVEMPVRLIAVGLVVGFMNMELRK